MTAGFDTIICEEGEDNASVQRIFPSRVWIENEKIEKIITQSHSMKTSGTRRRAASALSLEDALENEGPAEDEGKGDAVRI